MSDGEKLRQASERLSQLVDDPFFGAAMRATVERGLMVSPALMRERMIPVARRALFDSRGARGYVAAFTDDLAVDPVLLRVELEDERPGDSGVPVFTVSLPGHPGDPGQQGSADMSVAETIEQLRGAAG